LKTSDLTLLQIPFNGIMMTRAGLIQIDQSLRSSNKFLLK
jgi:hypothetical protein